MDASDLALLATLDALLQEVSVTRAGARRGLSTTATSHALARLRERFGDPLLVRAGRRMVLTPRAEALKTRVRAAVMAAEQAFANDRPFRAAALERAFVIHATDHVLTVLGGELDRLAHEEAPGVVLRFVPNTVDDGASLRDGHADLAIGIYSDLLPELRTRPLMTDAFVCVVRKDHPVVRRTLNLDTFLALEHVQIAPRGRPGGYLDDQLALLGRTRRVARAVPFFLAALQLVAKTDYVLTLSERVARPLAPGLGLRVFPPPLTLKPYALKLVWHPRFDGDPAHAWLRSTFLKAAKRVAGDVHAGARTRLARR